MSASENSKEEHPKGSENEVSDESKENVGEGEKRKKTTLKGKSKPAKDKSKSAAKTKTEKENLNGEEIKPSEEKVEKRCGSWLQSASPELQR